MTPLANFPEGLPVAEFVPSSSIDLEGARLELVVWRSDRHLYFVYFSSTGSAETTGYNDVARLHQTSFENLVWRAKRLWRRWFP